MYREKIEILFHDMIEYSDQAKTQTNERTNKRRMAYYKNPDYCSEAEMKRQGLSEEEKAPQRELNWDIRIEHYAVKNPAQFVKMTDEWAASFGFPSPGVPTMKMLYILKLARQNGVASNTIIQFAGAEERLLKQRPGFVSPAAVLFNDAKYDANCRAAVPGMMPASSTARAAAQVKREKKAAATLARAAGKIAAAEKRAATEAAWTEGLRKVRAAIEKKVQAARKAMGVRKNEANPSGIREMKEKCEVTMMLALRKEVLGK